jgi:hypothetical protein
MSFLYPGFLFALLAVAVPVLIHLFNFRRFKKVYFSNVKFLRDIQVQTSSSRNLRRLLVLLARILAVVFLTLAFAKPYFPAGNQEAAHNRKIISVYIDNSYSMEAVNKDGSLLDEARRRAREIASAYTLNDKFQLLTNDFEGRHQRLLTYEDFLSALEDIRISGVSRTIPQIIQRQQDVFSGENNASKTSYILSDFQKNMEPKGAFVPDSSVSLRFVKIRAAALPNISIDSVWFVSPIHRPGATEKLVVQLRNNSDKEGQRIPIKLAINGQQKAAASLTIPPRASRSDTLSFSGLEAGWQSGTLTITDYPVVFDDHYYFAFNVRKEVNVLVVNAQSANIYLNAVYRSDPFFKLVNAAAGNLDYSTMNEYPLIILNSLPDISEGLVQQLKRYVTEGGTLMVFPSLEGDMQGLTNLLNSLGADVPEAVSETEEKVASLNARHSLFTDVFEKVPANIDLPVAKKFVRYSNRSSTTRQMVLGLPGGRIFFGQYTAGKGSVYLSAVPLDEDAGNFARHSVFVPLMYQAALLSLHDNRMSYTLGRDQFFEVNHVMLGNNQVLKLKRDDFEVIPDVQQTANATRIYVADQLRDEGIYRLQKGDSVIAVAGFNDNRDESVLDYMEPGRLEKLFPGRKITLFDTEKATIHNDIKGVNEGVHLWKVCLILALIFLAAETLLLRFYRIPETPSA